MNLNNNISINFIRNKKIPVEMYLDIHSLYVCDNTVEHTTNIHHVFLLMYHRVFQQWLEDNPGRIK